MSAIWPVAMHDRSRLPELQPDLEIETVHAGERMTMLAAEVTLFGKARRLLLLRSQETRHGQIPEAM
jgi:hypothetical protein